MEYAEYEGILAKLHEVEADDMSAFYGRLRVLRDRAGVPLASSPGKGKRRQFSDLDLWETHLALRLAAAGFPPQRIGLFFSKWVRPENVYQRVREHGNRGVPSLPARDDLFMLVTTHLNVGKGSEAEQTKHSVHLMTPVSLNVHFMIMRQSHVQFVLNVSSLTAELF